MALGDLLKGAGDMLTKAKEAIEETTGVDLDALKDSVADKLEDARDFVRWTLSSARLREVRSKC